ncbi:MAG: hypothetical protein LBD99_04550 [Candidatus Margulisbacteria bacterium]|nr:hypothetical protein [Candidatus Margulisiibacteriota bacterium]
MKKYWGILLFLLILPLSAKDPMGRGKSAFQPGRAYPQVDISGFEELEYNSLDQSGAPEKYQNTTEYARLPASVKVYDGLRHRRLIDLEGQISEKLYVRYKISQDPDLPQETDIYVEYANFSVYFGKYDAYLSNGSLFSLGKSIDGLHMDYLAENFEIEGIYGEERSHEREFSFYGSGQREYSLGQTNIQEGSLQVRLNGEELADSAYRIDYFDGKIIFNNILSSLDRVDGSYEYLDPIEDFLPISSKVRLSGVQHRYKTYRGTETKLVTASAAYRYTPEERVTVSSSLDGLWELTDFQYADRSLLVRVQDKQFKGVYAYIGDDDSRIPLRLTDNLWTLSLPMSSSGLKWLAVEYETESLNVGKMYALSIEEIISSPSVETTATENTEEAFDENLAGTEETGLELPEIPEISETLEPAAEQRYTVKQAGSDNYIIVLPDGYVFFEQTKFPRNTRLEFSFQPKPELPAPEQILVNFKADTMVMLRDDNKGGYTLSRPLRSDEALGENNCYLALDYGGGDERTYKIPFVVDYAAQQEHNLNRIQLTEYPLLSFGEKVFLSGEQLELNKDYKVNYATGVVTFLRPVPAAAEDLRVEYTYNQTKAAQEILKGDETQGPYKLANTLIVPESVSVLVNNLTMTAGEDYKLNAETGAISFTRKIKTVDTIQVNYKFYVSLTPAAEQKKESFVISSYFVQEQAKSAESEGMDAYTLSAGELAITADAGAATINIPIKYLPIVAGTLEVYDGSAKIPDSAYLISKNRSEYNGLIVISGAYTPANLSASFDQSGTALAPKVHFGGNNQTTIILDDIMSNLPKPIVYESIILEAKGKDSAFYVPLVYKRDYIIGYREDLMIATRDANGDAVVREDFDAWQRGVITFITGNVISGYDVYSGFAPEDQFRLTYKISNAETVDPGDILHQTYGTKFTVSPVDWLRADVEYNESRKQYQRSVLPAEVTANGQQEIYLATLLGFANPQDIEVVEDSEQVYINERLQIKNDHYSISYKGGIVRFRSGLVLSPSDNVRVAFSYYASGIGEEDAVLEKASAAKVDLTMRLGRTDITAGYVTVNSQYDPVGNPPALYPAGTEAKNIIINSRPADRLQLYSRVEQQNRLVGVYSDDNTVDRYQNTVYQNYKAAYGFNQNDSVALAYNRTDVDAPGGALDDAGANNRQQDYQMDLNVGPDFFRTGVFLKNAEAFANNYDAPEASSKAYNRNAKLTNYFRPLKDLNFSSSYARNIDDRFDNIRSLSESHAYTELIKYNPWTIDSSFEYSGADYSSGTAENHTDFTSALGRDRKQVFNLTFRRPPELKSALWEELYAHYDNTYSAIATDLHQQAPNTSRLNNFNAALRPYDIITLGYDDRYSYGLLENMSRHDFYQENIYKFSRFYPAKHIGSLPADFLIVNKVEVSKKANENARSVESGDTLHTYSLDNYFNVLQNYTLNPLDQLTMELEFNSNNVERYSEALYKTGDSYTESVEPQNTQKMKMNYALTELWGFSNIAYVWNLDSSQKRISKITQALNAAPTHNRDDLDSGTNYMTLGYNFLGSFTGAHTLQTLEEFKRKTGEGTRYSYGQTDAFSLRYDIPFTGVGLTYGLTRVYNNQFRYVNGIISKGSVFKDLYNEKLLRFDDTQRYTIDYTLFPQLVMDGSLYFRKVEQEIQSGRLTSAFLKSRGVINSKSYEFGVTYRPLTELSMRYGWRQNVFDLGFGEESRFTAKYTPLKFNLGELSYNYENVFTYGKGTNDPEQNDSLNSQNGFVQTAVVDRDDIKVTNTLIFRVNQDISNVIIDNMIIDINLTRLHFWDKINDSYSYSLNAFYAKGTINF